MKRSRRRRVPSEGFDDALLVEICTRFLEYQGVEQIVSWVREEHPGLQITRERVYALLGEARRRELFRLQVPDAQDLQLRMSRKLTVASSRVRVVAAHGKAATDQVAFRGAEVALDLLKELSSLNPGRMIRIGLGGGRTLRLLTSHFTAALRRQHGLPKLAVHALSSGFDIRRPQNAPITFLGSFNGVAEDIELVGLFSSGVLRSDELRQVRELPGIGESFKLAPEIDLVITSLASAKDSLGALNRFLNHGHDPALERSREVLLREGWVGDVLYEPYSNLAPIEADLPVRAVSVFELRELVGLATRPDKRVLLVVGPSESGRSKADALAPVLKQPSLKLWTDVVVDAGTARETLVCFDLLS